MRLPLADRGLGAGLVTLFRVRHAVFSEEVALGQLGAAH